MEGVVVPLISFTPQNIAALKQELLKALPDVKSGHADEALAAGIGFRTHAALLAALKAIGPAKLTVEITDARVMRRLAALGYRHTDTFDLAKAVREVSFQGYRKYARNLQMSFANQN